MNEVQLSLEQEFNLKAFQQKVENLSHEQARTALVGLYFQYLRQETYYRNAIKEAWGIESPAL